MIPFSQFKESLDRPYDLDDVTKSVSSDLIAVMRKHNYQNMQFYQVKNEPGHAFFVGRKNGFYEIHHQFVKDGYEIHDKNLMDKTPSKFVTTAFFLIDQKLKSSKPVKIIASEDHIENYHRLAGIIARKKNYTVSDISRSGDSYEFIIRPDAKNSLFEGYKI